MKLDGEYTFDGPREEVWKLVRDPEVLATALPGTQRLEIVGENEYEGDINLRIGPVAGVFSGRLVVSDEEPPENCTLTVEGKGSPGFAKGTGHVNLSEIDENTTLMKYEGEMQVGGRLASVGQRLLDTASKSMIKQGLDTLNEALKARIAAEEAGEEVDFQAPTETEFAAAVAKDMAGEIFSSKQIIWIVVAVVVLVLILVFILLANGG